MEVLSEDQTLQAVFGRDLGLDNDGLNFQELEDYITSNDICIPEEAIPAVAYSNGRPPDVCGGGGPGMDNSIKLNIRLQQGQGHMGGPPAPLPPHTMTQPMTAPAMYCSVPTPRGCDPQVHMKHPSLPDSPPDSGSEPYSPPDGNNLARLQLAYGNNINHQTHPQEAKQGLHGPGLGSVVPGAQHMYPHPGGPGPQPPMPHMPQSKAAQMPGQGPPVYLPEPPKLNHLPPTSQMSPPHLPPHHQISPPLNHPILPPHFGSMNNLSNHPNKKRKYSDSPNNTVTSNILNNMNSVMNIKQEPSAKWTSIPLATYHGHTDESKTDNLPPQGPDFSGSNFSPYGLPDCSGDDDYCDIDPSGGYMDSTYQVIKWQPYQQNKWAILTDSELKDCQPMTYRVDADKGFNFSVPDDSFVCQKKNHFQVTVHMHQPGEAKYVRTPDGVKKIEHFFLHFSGVKVESPTQVIKIEQSQSDRSKKPFYPVKVDLSPETPTKITVGRLHFSETTSNNMRKKGKPNPDQRYFMLVVALQAHSSDANYIVAASASERIIVRASNPGQFDSDVDVLWSKGHTQDSVYHVGRVGINTDHPEEALTVHGNLRLTGHLMQPSDQRAKENLKEVNTKEQLQNVQKMRLYHYQYSKDFSETTGIPEHSRSDTGVLAQEILEVLPDAVQETGDLVLNNGKVIENFMHVNKDRLFMENVGAVKELCKLTDNLENRIDELERMNQKLTKLKRFDSLKSTVSSKSTISTVSTVSSSAPKKPSSGEQKSHHHHHHHSKHSKHSSSSSSSSSSSRISSVSGSSKRSTAQNQGMCTNRFIQITIIILILIMAFCLVAITTLYILERGKDPNTTSPPHVLQGTRSHTTPHNPWVPTGETSSSPSVPGPEVSTAKSSTTAKPTTGSTSLPTMTTSATRQTTVKIPPYPQCDSNCEAVCCPPPSEDAPVNRHTVDNEITPKTTLNTVVIYNPNQSGRTDPTVIYNNNNQDNYNSYNVITNGGSSGRIYRRRRHARFRRNIATEMGIQMTLQELNFTIGTEYCRTCQGGQSPQNATYLLPLSPYFGFLPLTLRFGMNVAAYVKLCENKSYYACPGDSSATNRPATTDSEPSSTVDWRLAIGTNFRTTYRFRISQTNLGVCEVPDNEMDGSAVIEYTLIFERTCPEGTEM